MPENRFSHDAKTHYHACRYCDEDEDEAQALAHRTGVAAHSYNANGVCVTCGYSAGGKLYIAKQPRDVRCKTSIYDGYDEDPANGLLYMEHHPVTFTVTVKGGKGNYHYQWYRGKHKGGFDPLVNDPALTGANEATLTVYLDAEACSGGLYYSFYCVVTDDAGAKVTTNTVSIKASHVYGADRGENVTPKNAADALYKAAAYSYIDKSGKTRTVTAEASSGHRFPCLCELNWKTIHYKSKSPAMHTFGAPKRLGKSAKENALDTDLVYEQTCTGCGYVAYYETHTHVFRDENHHGYFGDFEVNEAKTTVLAHALNCLFEGCETVKMEQHEWNWRTVSYPSAGSNGGFYRECRICTYPDYDLRPADDKGTEIYWTTDNVLITAERTQVSTSLAKVGDKITLTYNNESNVGVRCIGFSVTYTDPDGKKHDISPRFRYTQNEDGSLTTTVSTGGYKTGGVLYFEPWGDRCKDHDYITVNYKPAVCMYEGYEGDVICKYCKSPSPDDTKTPEEKIIEAKSDHHTGKRIPLYYAADGKTATTDKSSGKRYGAQKGDCEKRGCEGDFRCADCGRNIAGKWDFMHPSYAIEVKNERVVSCFKNGYSGDEFCERCGKTVSKGYVIQAPKEHTTHFYDPVYSPAVEATCTTAGKGPAERCMLCNELMNNGEYVPALGHEWTKDAEKSTAETTAYKCTRTGCTATMLQAVATEKYDITVVGGSAYLTAGSTIAKAAEGAVVKLKAEPPKGKALEKWEVTSGGVTLKDAEKADGASFVMPKGAVKITAKFADADHVHTPTGDWKSDAKTHWHTCKDCTARADEAKHSFVWKTDKAATETATGLKHEECTVCGYQRSKNTVIDKLGGKVGSFAYQTLMSTADSVVSSVLGNVGGAAAIGGSAFASAIVDAKESGISDEQALMTGICAGIFETLFERVSIGNFNKLKEVPPATLRDVALNILKSTGVNASEEGATEIANILADTIINGDYSGYAKAYQSYLAAGKSEKEAERLAKQDMAKQVGMAAFGGAVQGFFMGGIGTTWGYFGNRDANRAAGAYFTDENGRINAENRNALIGEGLASGNEEIRAYAGTLEDKRTMSQAEAGQLYRMLVAQTQGNYTEEKAKSDDTSLPAFSEQTLVQNKQLVSEMQPVSRITGNEFQKGEVDLITQVANFFKSLGNKAFNEEIGSVTVDRRGAKTDIAHGIGRKKAASFQAVFDVINNGKVVDYQTNWKGRGYDTAVVAAPITIGTTPYYMGVVLTRSQGENRFYVHEVFATDEKGTSPFKTGTTASSRTPGEDAPSVISILNSIREVKNNANNVSAAADSQGFPDFSDRSLDEPISETEFRAAYAARVAREAAAERAKTQADTDLGNMLSGELTNGRADEIAKSQSLTNAFEALTGEKLTGTLAEKRKQLKAMQTYAAEKLRDARADARMAALKTADTREKMRAAVGSAGQAVYDAGYDAGVAAYKLRGFAGDALLAPSELYNANFGAYYRQGYHGDAFDFMDNAAIVEANARRIYEAGQRDAKADTYLNAAERSAFEHGVSAEEGATAKRLSQVLGKEILFIDADADFHGCTIDGVIYLGAKSERSVLATVAHEYTHLLEGKGLYDKLRDFVFDTLAGEGATAEDLRAAKRAEHELYAGLDDEKVDREIVAEFVETRLLTDEQVMREVVRREGKSFARRLLDVLRGLIEKVKAALHIGDADAEQLKMLERGRDILAEVIRSEEAAADADGIAFSMVGKNKNGIEVYETSDAVKKLSYNERKALFLEVMKNQYKGRTARFVRNGHTYYALFSDGDIRKNIYGDKRSDTRGWKAKITAGADGDIFNLVENAAYDGSKMEFGKDIDAHRDVHHWDYFIKTVQIDGKLYNLNANVRKTDSGEFVYFLEFRENKKTEAAPLLRATNGSSDRMLTASVDTSVSQDSQDVNSHSMQNSENDADIRFSVGGAKAKTADVGRLELAQRMIEGGADSETVRRETGWYRGYDGKWRFEIDDSKMRFINHREESRRTWKLDELIRHDALFAAYPELRNYTVLNFAFEDGVDGVFSPGLHRIMLNPNLDRAGKRAALIHEIQHAIQVIEGFAAGSSTDYWQDAFVTDEEKRTERHLLELSRKNRLFAGDMYRLLEDTPDARRDAQRDALRAALVQRHGEKAVREFTDTYNHLLNLQKQRTERAEQAYRNTAGEIEAADVASRLGLSAKQRAETRPDIDRTDVRFSKKHSMLSMEARQMDENITVDDLQTIRAIGRKSVNDFTSEDVRATEKWARKFYRELGTKSPFFRAWFGDWRAGDTSPVSVVAASDTQNKTAGKTQNRDTGMTISWSSALKGETKNHAVKDRIAVQAVNDIAQIVQNAVYLDTESTTPTSKSKMPGTAFMHSFYTLYKAGGSTYLLKMYVEEAISSKDNAVFDRAYQLKDIEKVASVADGVLSENGGLTEATHATTYSISDLYALVKQYDKDFKPKAVSPALLNEDGTPKVVYHGTNSEAFTVFDSDKSGRVKKNVLGDGYYFAAEEESATHYGEHVMPVYLDMKNPYKVYARDGGMRAQMAEDFNMDANAISRGDIQSILKANGYDGVLLYSSKYAADGDFSTAVVFDNTQIKSATDNVGTFDSENPDIHFSVGGGQTNADTDTEVSDADKRYEGKTLYADSEVYSYDFLTALPDISVVRAANLSELEEDGKVSRVKVTSRGKANAGAQSEQDAYIKNRYTGRMLTITNSSIRHGLHGNENSLKTNSRLSAVIGDIVKNAVPVNGLVNKDANAIGTYAMAAPARGDDGRLFVAIVTIEVSSGKVTNVELKDLVHAISGRVMSNKENDPSDTKSQAWQEILRTLTNRSEISISDFLQIVNRTHQSILSADVLQHLGEARNLNGHFASEVLFSVGNADTDTEVSDTDKRFAPVESAIKLLKGGADFQHVLRETGASPREIALRMQTGLRLRRKRKTKAPKRVLLFFWLRRQDLNLRPSGYEPDELPGCSTPRYYGAGNRA